MSFGSTGFTQRFRVNEPVPREPILNVPRVVAATLLLLVAVHAARVLISPHADDLLVTNLAFVPLRLTALVNPTGTAAHLSAWAGAADAQSAARGPLAAYLLTQVRVPAVADLLTYAVLHGGWAHLGLNSIWLLAFGTPVARRFGPARFCALMAVSAVAGAASHWALFPFDTTPLVGASAAVSGCMGAALRFAFRAREPGEDGGLTRPAESLWTALRDKRTASFLVAWFVSNALFGIGSESFGLSAAPVAWQAHVGGFLVGLLLFRVFDPPQQPPQELPA